MGKNYTLSVGQSLSLRALYEYPDVPYVFFIGGFGAGKSFTDVQIMLWLYQQYKDYKEEVKIGVFGVTIKLLSQTVLADFERMLDYMKVPYRDNSKTGTLTVGSLTFVYLPMQVPDDIYAFNFSACLVDEIDELPSDKIMAVVKAIQERNRIDLPASRQMPARAPFVFFSTTAQGMGGTYMLIQYLKKQGVKYMVIRGKTEDNPSLSKQQVALLRKLYTEEEARAFLDGEFVNLTNGRVYPMFDRKKHMYMRFGVQDIDTVYVGQDFNLGFNAATEIIVRAGKMFVVDAHHWEDMGEGLRELRERYPRNKIVLIPDASGKQIMAGFREEAVKYDIDIHWNSCNASILESVMAVNKALNYGQLFVMEAREGDRKSLMDKLLLALETQDFDDNTGKPRKGKGEDALDHGADTLRYAVWHIVHTVQGFDDILRVLAHGRREVA